MEQSPLANSCILIVEDEPVIAIGLEAVFHRYGAAVMIASTVSEAAKIADERFSLAVLDHGLADGNSSEIYALLRDLGVPFIIHSGHDVPLEERCGGTVVSKPALEADLIATAEQLLTARKLQRS